MKGSIITTRSRKGGIRIRATGSAAQALFDALCPPRNLPAPEPESAPTPASTELPKVQIGPLDV